MAETILATVLFTDIVRSSDHASRLGDRRWGALLERHNAAVRAQLDRFGGREITTAGDGFLASFDGPGNAVRCAAAITSAVRELGISVRAGIHTGECEVIDDKLGGLAVHIGARVSAEAAPDEVLVSGTVRDLLAGAGLVFEDRGVRALRGIPGEWQLCAVDQQALPEEAPSIRIQLCGRVVVSLDGRRVEDELPGRQGTRLLAYLVLNRLRPAGRDELVDALWPDSAPPGAATSLSPLLSKLRRVLGAGVLEGRSSVRLRLPTSAWVDFEAAAEGIHRAESALAQRDWGEAWSAARVALHIGQRGFLPGEHAPWIDETRRRLEDIHLRSLEVTAQASMELGGGELDTAERSARSLIALAPYRESGYRYVMEVLARRDNVAEALRVYDGLRIRLREELGAAPSPATQELHRRLLA